jgi:molecular chaperone GrpE
LTGPEDDRDPERDPEAEGRPESRGAEPTGLVATELSPAEELEGLKRERDELKDQVLRRRAEFENFRKRVERDRQQAARDAESALVQRLIPSLDNLERALEAEGPDASLRQGVELTRRELLAALEAAGLRIDDPLGKPFDPETQQALETEVVPGQPEGTVVAVFRKAYFLGDRLLRPALVKVAKAGRGPGAAGEGPEAVH